MKNNGLKRFMILVTAGALLAASTACGSSAAQAPYFTKGVYFCQEEESFYVFYDEKTGRTELTDGIGGLPFTCAQEDGKITFHMGGEDDESVRVLTVKSSEEGSVTGAFEDGKELVFSFEQFADPDNFDALNYIGGGADTVYRNPNGWSVRYDEKRFDVKESGNEVSFIYKDASAGENSLTASYIASKDPDTVLDELSKTWGTEAAEKTEGTFPGTSDVKGYWLSYDNLENGVGDTRSAIAREYMEGTLVFEMKGHNTGDDEKDMESSDSIAMLLDTLEFDK